MSGFVSQRQLASAAEELRKVMEENAELRQKLAAAQAEPKKSPGLLSKMLSLIRRKK